MSYLDNVIEMHGWDCDHDEGPIRMCSCFRRQLATLRANQLPANVVAAVRAYAIAYQEEHNAITALEPGEERCRLADLAAAKALGDFQSSISQWRIESDAKERG